jgi:hypothetical protein
MTDIAGARGRRLNIHAQRNATIKMAMDNDRENLSALRTLQVQDF